MNISVDGHLPTVKMEADDSPEKWYVTKIICLRPLKNVDHFCKKIQQIPKIYYSFSEAICFSKKIILSRLSKNEE